LARKGKDDGMIYLKRMNNKEFILNVDLIEFIEESPDTIITLTNGHTMSVTERSEEIIKKIIEYKRKIFIHDIDVVKLYK
jgi:flagellar protein FlbD